MSNVISDLFDTNAIRVAPEETPFWYTSGKLGPFYINTHFLLKSEEDANHMLKVIEEGIISDKLSAPKVIFDELLKYYNESETYRRVIDAIVLECSKFDFDYVSGGERRDYFFSMIPAFILKKPHLTIYKDLSSVVSTYDFSSTTDEKSALKGKKVLHIADLITEASSYERAWVPVIRALEANITNTIAVIDRKQNGEKVLEALGVKMSALYNVDFSLFEKALENSFINDAQLDLVRKFITSPDDYMRDFISNNPDFIDSQIKLGGKAKERAELAISKGYV